MKSVSDVRRYALRTRVYYEDTDAGGIVYHATYLRWMERVRSDWLRALGMAPGVFAERTGLQCVVSELAISYRRPARLDEAVLCDLSLQECRRASLRLRQQCWLEPAETLSERAPDSPPESAWLLTDATVRLAVLDRTTGRPAALPNWLLERLEV